MDNETILLNVFTNINFWLKYAEKKNTYIFSFFSLMIIFTPFIGKLTSLSTLLKTSICIFYIIYIATMIVTIISLFPKTTISKNETNEEKNKKLMKTDNLLFYGDITKYGRDEYIDRLKEEYKMNICDSLFLIHLIDQIIINSTITQKKMNCFKLSSILTILALVEFTICFGVNLWISQGA